MKTVSFIASFAVLAGMTNAQQSLRGSSNTYEGEVHPDRDLQSSYADFCWLDSYGRGVGTPLNTCPSGKEKIGALCYSKCPSGTKRVGFDCHSVCPPGFRDDGLFCRLAEYGRGAGFPWQFGDGFSDGGMYRRCEAKHGRGNCEKWGAVVYPKCRSGYKPFGCCICRPDPPNCSALGLNNGFDLSCAKKVQIGDPTPMQCPSHKEYDAALCYDKCKSGYNGVGPVCWSNVPQGWVNCGMGASSSALECADAVVSQITSVGEIALFVASLGTSSSAFPATAPAKLVDFVNDLRKMYKKFKPIIEFLEQFQNAVDFASWFSDLGELIEKEVENGDITPVDAVRLMADLISIFDPTGVSSAVAAYTYDTCDKM